MKFSEIQFTRPIKLPGMGPHTSLLKDVEGEATPYGLLLGQTLVPWAHVLSMTTTTALPADVWPDVLAPATMDTDTLAILSNDPVEQPPPRKKR